MFRDQLKQEMKNVKLEADNMPKDIRKDALRQLKDEKEIQHAERVSVVLCKGQ